MKNKVLIVLFVFLLAFPGYGQEPLGLKECLDYAVSNNLSLMKDRLSIESAFQSKREVVGALLPQISASGGFTDNIQKTRIVMPNFVNDMMPESMRDPDASKYMSVTMGTDLNANWGVTLSQQLLNFSLFSAVKIASTAEEMAKTGVEISTDEIIAQTASLYYNVQVLEYAITKFDESLEIMDRIRRMMEVFKDNGIVRKVDADQIQVARINLETEKANIEMGLDVQRKLLKLEMGYDMNESLSIKAFNQEEFETIIFSRSLAAFDVMEQLPYKIVRQRQTMLDLQRKAAVYETLPALVLTGGYSNYYLGDKFSGPTYQHFPVSMVMLNLKVPIFTGFSKNAKIKKADIELKKAARDEQLLVQSLTMAYSNANNQLEVNRKVVDTQRRNKDLAEEVMAVTEKNYAEGLSSLSDLLNANSSFIQAQMNYVNALNKCVKAYIDLKKTDGTIKEIKD